MRKLLLVILILATLLSLVLCVNAHSGRTDGAGGHYNRSTGEYHYHHGHSAHDHYDMDGDGDVDCPYDFKDTTNHGSSNNSENEDKQQPTTQQDTDDSKPQKERKKINRDIVPFIVLAIIIVLSWVVFIWFCSL